MEFIWIGEEREREMDSKDAAGLVKMAVLEQLIDERLRKASSDDNSSNKDGADEDDGDHNRFISRLLSKLENLREEKNNDDLKKMKNEEPSSSSSSPAADDQGNKDGRTESSRNDEIIVRELRKVKKQNFITHCLLSAMIVLTLTWQLSEVSMIFKLKDGINHPFRSISQFLGLNKTTQPPLLNQLPGIDLKHEEEEDDD